jgi:hypothetical protein
MSRKTVVVITLGLGLAASVLAAMLVRFLSGPMSGRAFVGWIIFFASLQTSLVTQAVRTGQLDACSAWLLRLKKK